MTAEVENMRGMDTLPMPDVIEIDLHDIDQNLIALRKLGEDPTIQRCEVLNAALMALPVIDVLVKKLKDYDGELRVLPEIEGCIHKVTLFNKVSHILIAEHFEN